MHEEVVRAARDRREAKKQGEERDTHPDIGARRQAGQQEDAEEEGGA